MPIKQDLDQAREFLTLLDETETQFTFQTFDDNKDRADIKLASWKHGNFDDLAHTLVRYNDQGAGVFVMVQAGNGLGRDTKSVNRIRAVFNENDNGVTSPHPLDPHIVVQSSPGKYHYYFLCDGLRLDEFKPIQKTLITKHGSDHRAADLPRVLRLPGFFHHKEKPFMVSIVHESGELPYSAEQIKKAFPPFVEKERPKESVIVDSEVSISLRSALGSLRADDYELWIKIGLALSSLGDVGRGLWLEWGSQYDNYDFVESCKKWDTFKPDEIGYKSVFFEAAQKGWINDKIKAKDPVEKKTPSIDFELIEIAELIKNPVNISWTIRHLIEHNGVSLLYGKYGCGKSLVAFDMAYCVASGIDWHGKKTKRCPVVVLAGEGHSGIGDRFNALNIHYGNEFPRQLYLSKVAAKLSDSTNADWVMQAVEKVCPEAGLIVIDTLNRNFGVGDENSTKDMTLFIANIDNAFRNRGKTVIIVHHSGKNAEAGARGSIVLPGSVEAELSVTGGDGALTISVEKQKNGKKLDNIPLRFKEIDLNRVDDEGEAIHSLVLLDELNAEFKHTFPGRPKTREAAFWRAFDACVATDPITINGKIGVSKEIICNEFKIMAGLTGKSASTAFSEVVRDLCNEGKLLQISNIYIKSALHGNN